MLQFDRTRSRHDSFDGAGRHWVLVTERLSIRIGLGAAGGGARYDRPVAVEREGAVTVVTDLVMVARLAGLLAVTLAMIVRVMRR